MLEQIRSDDPCDVLLYIWGELNSAYAFKSYTNAMKAKESVDLIVQEERR